MTDLTATSVQSYVTTQITDFSGSAAVIISATIVVGLAIFLAFKGLKWLKGAM